MKKALLLIALMTVLAFHASAQTMSDGIYKIAAVALESPFCAPGIVTNFSADWFILIPHLDPAQVTLEGENFSLPRTRKSKTTWVFSGLDENEFVWEVRLTATNTGVTGTATCVIGKRAGDCIARYKITGTNK